MAHSIKRVKGPVAVTVAVFSLLAVAFALFLVFCRVDSFEVVGCQLYSEDEIVEMSGIEQGSFLFSVDREAVSDRLLHTLSVIKEVEISVKLPDKVVIKVVEAPPTFFADIGVSAVMFGYELRVAEVKQNSKEGSGICVALPEVSKAIGGERIEFSDGEPTYITKILEAVAKWELYDRVTLIDCRTARDASVEVDGKYTLIFGGASELDTKLRVAAEYLKTDRLSEAKNAVLDLTSPKEVIVSIED